MIIQTKKYAVVAALIIFCFLNTQFSNAQKSVLINYGGIECKNSDKPNLSFIKNPFDLVPTSIGNCNLQSLFSDFYDSYASYNPWDNKVYIADVRTGTTKLWSLDIGLSGNIIHQLCKNSS